MNNHPCLTYLAEWIAGIFQKGIVLTDELARFLEVTFGSRHIADIPVENGGSEIDSFIELLCFPDINTQVLYESRWGDQAFSAHDLASIVKILCAAPRRANIISPSGALLCALDIPSFAMEAFVRRLNITWRPPHQLARTLEKRRRHAAGLKIGVHLRNTALPWHEEQVRLIKLFLQKMPAESGHFETSFTFVLSILSELPPGCDGHEFLIGKKFFYFQSLCRAENFERKRLSSNMEIMIMQGARAAHGSIDVWRSHMQRIDLICQTLFGRTRFFQEPGEQYLDTAGKDTAQKIQNLMHLLS